MTNSKSKKLLTLMLTLAMVVSLLAGLGITASAAPDSYWNGVIPTANPGYTFSGGNGTTPFTAYQINTAADLAQLAANVAAGMPYQGDYFSLNANIFLNATAINPENVLLNVDGPCSYPGTTVYEWLPIGRGSELTQFRGHFNGNENTIYNAFYKQTTGDIGGGVRPGNNAGIFGSVGMGSVIENLNVDGGYIGAQRSVGGVVGRNMGGTVRNCVNYGNYVFANGTQGTGGVVGASWVTVTSGVADISRIPRVNNCSNYATVENDFDFASSPPPPAPQPRGGSVGGIVGENEGLVFNSFNTGDLSSTFNAGGIVGSNQRVNPQHLPNDFFVFGHVNNCYNTGDVSAEIAGGIIGFQFASAQNVYNIGTITTTAPMTGGAAGQIIGELDSEYDNDNLFRPTGTMAVGSTIAGSVTAPQFGDSPAAQIALTDALNEWVDENISFVFRNWTRSNSVNDGFPTFD